MKMKLLAAAAIGVMAASAYADPVDIGPLTAKPFWVEASLVPAGAFDEFYTFSLPSLLNVQSTTVANNLSNVLNITGGSVSLFSGSIGSGTELASYNFDGTTGSSTHTVANLTAGNYYFEVKGTASNQGGLYTLTTSAVPVPEPETYAMLLAGLGIVGSLYRRRKAD
jgi:hypothetical protein